MAGFLLPNEKWSFTFSYVYFYCYRTTQSLSLERFNRFKLKRNRR
ncbi:hypothetical protein ALT1644_200017 [Alteromonas macleodii]